MAPRFYSWMPSWTWGCENHNDNLKNNVKSDLHQSVFVLLYDSAHCHLWCVGMTFTLLVKKIPEDRGICSIDTPLCFSIRLSLFALDILIGIVSTSELWSILTGISVPTKVNRLGPVRIIIAPWSNQFTAPEVRVRQDQTTKNSKWPEVTLTQFIVTSGAFGILRARPHGTPNPVLMSKVSVVKADYT